MTFTVRSSIGLLIRSTVWDTGRRWSNYNVTRFLYTAFFNPGTLLGGYGEIDQDLSTRSNPSVANFPGVEKPRLNGDFPVQPHRRLHGYLQENYLLSDEFGRSM
jgi:hypothetical protein